MSDLGIDANKVYANDGDTNPAFWTLMGGVHGRIVQALQADPAVQVAIKAKLQTPNDPQLRGHVVDLIDRATVNCLGQAIAGKALQPAQATFTIYNLLDPATSTTIDSVIGSPQNTALHDAFAAQDADAIVTVISRQTGRALFQTCVAQMTIFAADPFRGINALKNQLIQLAQDAVPGAH